MRYVVVAWDRITGETYISSEMLQSEYDEETARVVLDGLVKTMGESRLFFLLPYTEVNRFIELENEKVGSTGENRRIIH